MGWWGLYILLTWKDCPQFSQTLVTDLRKVSEVIQSQGFSEELAYVTQTKENLERFPMCNVACKGCLRSTKWGASRLIMTSFSPELFPNSLGDQSGNCNWHSYVYKVFLPYSYWKSESDSSLAELVEKQNFVPWEISFYFQTGWKIGVVKKKNQKTRVKSYKKFQYENVKEKTYHTSDWNKSS